MSTDIFPEIDIPVVSVVWQYTGMPADEIESRIVFVNERVLTSSVNDIEHIESQSLDGVGVIRIYFHPGAKIAEARSPGDRHLPDAAEAHAAWHHAAVHRPLQRDERADRADRRQQRYADRTTDLRLRQNFVIQQLGTVQRARWPSCSASPWARWRWSPPRRGLLPGRRRRPVPAARPGAVGHAHRGDRADLRPGRGRDPRDRARQRAGHDPRQHGPDAVVHDPGLRR